MFKLKPIVLIALIFLLPAAFPALAAEKPAASKEELKRIQEELKGVRKKASEAKRQERSILTEIEGMDMALTKKRGEVKEAEEKLGQVGREMGRTEAEITTKKAGLSVKQSDLSSRLRAMYKSERSGGPWALLITGDYDRMLKRYKYLSALSRHDKKLMDSYAGSLRELDTYKGRLEEQSENFDRLKRTRDEEAKSVQAEEERKRTVLASVQRQKSSYEAMARELEESGHRMQDLLRQFETESARAKPVLPGAPGSFPSLRAGLDWPVTGKVVGRFGKQKHPDYDTYIFKKGIEVEASLGDDVRAVESAQVVFANWFKGLGLIAILKHGGDFYTVYAHLAELKVKNGDRVSRGQVIATLGDTGAPAGPSLYFELRKGSEAMDPLKWLKKAGTK